MNDGRNLKHGCRLSRVSERIVSRDCTLDRESVHQVELQRERERERESGRVVRF